ncbi:MAG: FAD-dependent monooxygenase [Gammaproteobacteria bacterium]
MNNREHDDIAIVGGGIVGMTAALAMADYGYQTMLVEPRPIAVEIPPRFDPRSYAITEASINVFAHLGVWRELDDDRNADIMGMSVWDASSNGHIEFSPAHAFASRFGVITEHANLARALQRKISSHPFINVHHGEVSNLELMPDGRRLHFSNSSPLTADLVICADGARSAMRSAIGIDAVPQSYGQQALVCNVESDKPHGNVARQVFHPQGPLAFLPLAHPRQSAVVWTNGVDRTAELIAATDESLALQIAQAFNFTLGDVAVVSDRFEFPLFRMHVPRYDAQRAVLVGDAAHIVHPLAGQGLNLGIMDVAVLAEALGLQSRASGLTAARLRSALRRYSRCRSHDNGLMLRVTDSLNSIFARPEKFAKAARGWGLILAGKISPLRHLFTQHALGYAGETPSLARPTFT